MGLEAVTGGSSRRDPNGTADPFPDLVQTQTNRERRAKNDLCPLTAASPTASAFPAATASISPYLPPSPRFS